MELIYEGPPLAPQPCMVTCRYTFSGFQPAVSPGVTVASGDLLATKPVSEPLVMIDVAAMLNKKRKGLGRNIAVEEGGPIERGQRIATAAGPFGFGRRDAASPVDGVVAAVLREQALVVVRPPDTTEEIHAGIDGVVSSVSPSGIDTETPCFVIRGIVGTGGQTVGVIRVLSPNSTAEAVAAVAPGQVPAVLVSRSPVAPEVLDRVIAAWQDGRVSALVVPAAPQRAFEAARTSAPGFVLVATEGFGGTDSGMTTHEAIWSLLSRCDGMRVAIDAGPARLPLLAIASGDRAAVRPTSTSVPLSEGAGVRALIGTSVRAGRAVKMLPGIRPMGSGYLARVAEVSLDTGDQIMVPVDAVETVTSRED